MEFWLVNIEEHHQKHTHYNIFQYVAFLMNNNIYCLFTINFKDIFYQHKHIHIYFTNIQNQLYRFCLYFELLDQRYGRFLSIDFESTAYVYVCVRQAADRFNIDYI